MEAIFEPSPVQSANLDLDPQRVALRLFDEHQHRRAAYRVSEAARLLDLAPDKAARLLSLLDGDLDDDAVIAFAKEKQP